MPEPGARLAARFREAMARKQRREQEAREAEARRAAAARAARDELVGHLEAFGRALPFLAVQRRGDELIFRHGDHALVFEPKGDGQLLVERPRCDDTATVYRETQLGDRWVIALARQGREHRLPLFDQGLEELLVSGLDLPRPDDTDGPSAP
jgi:hypothetical protein